MTSAASTGPTPAQLAALQAALLRSAIDGAPLPGGAPAVALPDRGLVVREGVARLLDEALAPGLAALLPRGVLLVSRDQLRRDAAARGDAAFLRLAPPAPAADVLWLSLEVRLAPADGTRDVALGGVQVGVRAAGSEWRVVEPPRAFAV